MNINTLPFIKDVLNYGKTNIFQVGGAVRDSYIGKKSKDLDIVITGIPYADLTKILQKYGRVDLVGESFGIIKFKENGSNEDIDIALPRTEKPTGDVGHKAFDVQSDHNLPIEDDLSRRDFTINAIAKDINNNIIDPYNGVQDIKNKVIRAVSNESFSDDPLRMLRAVQFATRFGFSIDPKTMEMIKKSSPRIREISKERVLTEFDKIVQKGNPVIGYKLLVETNLFNYIFGKSDNKIINLDNLSKVLNVAEFVFVLSFGIIQSPAEFYKNNLKGDIDGFKRIRVINATYDSNPKTPADYRYILFKLNQITPQVFDSNIIKKEFKQFVSELITGRYPKQLGELKINGNDVTNFGFKGKEVGEKLNEVIYAVYSDVLKNEREEQLKFIKK